MNGEGGLQGCLCEPIHICIQKHVQLSEWGRALTSEWGGGLQGCSCEPMYSH